MQSYSIGGLVKANDSHMWPVMMTWLASFICYYLRRAGITFWALCPYAISDKKRFTYYKIVQ